MKLKKILPVVFLVILLIWGVYDMWNKNNINRDSMGNANINREVNSQNDVELKIGIGKGDLAPDFEVTTLEGEQVRLSDYRGKKVILNFWATWCPPCRAEMPDMQEFYSTYKDEDIVILGVNLIGSEQSQSSVKDFIKSYEITYPILLDKGNTVSVMYKVSSIPTSYIIDSRGIISEKVVGPMDFDTMKNLIDKMN